MRIATIGGGPAGLYASLLLKKADPRHEITLYERNPAGATYGWGVVFSDRTLSAFREADLRTFERITDAFVLWDAITIHHRGQAIRSGGHVFAGLARVQLLRILAERCDELGVELRFEEEAPAADALDADLVIAADGVRSLTRDAHEKAFRPRFQTGAARYIWFGVPLPLDSFTFSFRETEHGLFQAHAYPFDGEMSTFIAECHEDVWRRAGLEEADEAASIAFCQEVFADDLRGRELRSNRSAWISFVTVRCRAWCDDGVVLLGDAAHTAHFSIGSGTKLAMEDAIALARAVERHGENRAAALAEYEAERRPVVERFQEAAAESRTYFEHAGRYVHLPTPQFAFNLLTRSGRIDHDVLRIRDAAYLDGVDRWFAGTADVVAPPPLFTPLELRGVTFRNRVVSTGEAAGAGLALTPIVPVAPEGRITPEDPSLADLPALVERAHIAGARAGVRLGHAGRRGATRPRRAGIDRPLPPEEAWPLLAPSAIALHSRAQIPKEMARADMDAVRKAFVLAARAAHEAGADLLQVHMAHGYLLGSFLSPLTNLREDGYGDDGRLRFPLEVLDAVREAWDGPLCVAMNATDWARGGVEPAAGVEIAAALREDGADLIQVLAGYTVPRMRPRFGRAFLAPLADRIRNEARVPVLVGGGITTTGTANTLLAAGRADLVILDPPR